MLFVYRKLRSIIKWWRSLWPVTLVKLCNLYLQERDKHVFRKEIKRSTWVVYETKVKVITLYLAEIKRPTMWAKKADIEFAENLLDHFLRKGLTRDYANYTLREIHNALKFGVRKKLIKHNPLQNLDLKFDCKVKGDKLTMEQQEKLQNYVFSKERHNYYRDIFMLQIIQGVAHSDINKLSRENIIPHKVIEYGKARQADFFRFVKQKSRIVKETVVYVEVFPAALNILERYKWTFKRLLNATYNDNLDQIGIELGFPIKLTTHVGRRTFAQNMTDGKWSDTDLGIMMGHKDPATTRIYAQPGFERLVRARNDLMNTAVLN